MRAVKASGGLVLAPGMLNVKGEDAGAADDAALLAPAVQRNGLRDHHARHVSSSSG